MIVVIIVVLVVVDIDIEVVMIQNNVPNEYFTYSQFRFLVIDFVTKFVAKEFDIFF